MEVTGPRIVLVLSVLALPLPAAAQGRPDCATVIREIHRIRGHKGSRAPDALKIAEHLDTDSDWVQRCAASYGRHIKSSEAPKDPEIEASLREKREAEEFEELGREEKATLGDRYVTIIENDDTDRKHLKTARDQDSVNEWEPYETHQWEPNLGHAWPGPVLHDDDDPGIDF
jgi:hypothetical protein